MSIINFNNANGVIQFNNSSANLKITDGEYAWGLIDATLVTAGGVTWKFDFEQEDEPTPGANFEGMKWKKTSTGGVYLCYNSTKYYAPAWSSDIVLLVDSQDYRGVTLPAGSVHNISFEYCYDSTCWLFTKETAGVIGTYGPLSWEACVSGAYIPTASISTGSPTITYVKTKVNEYYGSGYEIIADSYPIPILTSLWSLNTVYVNQLNNTILSHYGDSSGLVGWAILQDGSVDVVINEIGQDDWECEMDNGYDAVHAYNLYGSEGHLVVRDRDQSMGISYKDVFTREFQQSFKSYCCLPK